jgi:uncharacterized membrane protein
MTRRHTFAFLAVAAIGCQGEASTAPLAVAAPTLARLTPLAASFKYQDLGFPAGYVEGVARAINDSGVVVGEVRNGTTLRPARWTNGLKELLALPVGVAVGRAWDVNASGTVVGHGHDITLREYPLRWNSSGVAILGDLGQGGAAKGVNGHGLVVGYVKSGSTHLPARWSASGSVTTLALPAGYVSGFAEHVNSAGDIIGTVRDGLGNDMAWLWRANGASLAVGSTLTGISRGIDIASSGAAAVWGITAATGYAARTAPPYASATILFAGDVKRMSNKERYVGNSQGQAYTLQGGTSVLLPLPAGFSGAAYGVNSCGNVVGSAAYSFGGLPRPVRWNITPCDT